MQNHDALPPSDRLHSLDAVRAVALCLGIVLHGALSYAAGVTLELWPMSDEQQSVGMSVMVFVIHIFRMSVFFLIAGFFAHILLHRRGTQGFLQNRAYRIALPLVLGWIVCIASIGVVVLWALTQANDGRLPDTIPPALQEAGVSFLHLWFLYILCWLYAGMLVVRWLVNAIDDKKKLVGMLDRGFCKVWAGPWGSVVLSLPICLALYLQPDWVWWFGIPTLGYTLLPPAVPLFVYGYFFALGCLLDRQRFLLGRLESTWYLQLLMGVGAAVICLKMAGQEASVSPLNDHAVQMAYAFCYGVSMVSLSLALLGIGVRFLNNSSPVVRCISDASYWMYIAHLPVVMALQVWLMPYSMHWSVKFFIVNVITFAFLLFTYRYWIRSSWVGWLLNGKRHLNV